MTLKNNPFKVGSKAYIFFNAANVDLETGYSDIILFTTRPELQTTNGGDWCRNDSSLGKYFNIRRIKKGIKIVGVQLMGYTKNTFERPVPTEIKNFFKGKKCVVLNVSGSQIEIDHKDGRYDIYNETPSKDRNNYQPMKKCVNDAKRTHCIVCKKTGVRFDARILGHHLPYWVGNEKYYGSCIGCYWYDPIEFNKRMVSVIKAQEKEIGGV